MIKFKKSIVARKKIFTRKKSFSILVTEPWLECLQESKVKVACVVDIKLFSYGLILS